MKRDYRKVNYSYEHGDKALPRLIDLVSDIPDPMKGKIMGYLRTHLIIARPGIIKDEINPERSIGSGNIYTDETYVWNDVFINYVDRYNIPVPEEFRTQILNNYDQRMRKHALLRLVDRIEIHNNPYLGFQFHVSITKNGIVRYENNLEDNSLALLKIKPDDARYIIDPITAELFCYDTDEHGTAMIDGYHWEIHFFRNNDLISKVEGWLDEDEWKYKQIRKIVGFAERIISKNLGKCYMTFYNH